MLPIGIDLGDKLSQRHALEACDFLHRVPKWIFKAHAGLVVVQDDRAFYDRRFHVASSRKFLIEPSGSLCPGNTLCS